MIFKRKVDILGDYDVVVVGSGPAGLSATVSVARLNKTVALIEKNGSIGGNLTSGFVGPMMGGYAKGSISEELNSMLNNSTGLHHNVEEAKYKLSKWIDNDNITLYLQAQVVDVLMSGKFINGVVLGTAEGLKSITGKIFIDATGDGTVAFLAGAPYKIGREDGLTQPASIMFTIENIDPKQTIDCCHEEHETILPNGSYLELCRNACKSGELPPNVNIVRLYKTSYSSTERMVNATQYNHIDGLNSIEIAKANLDLREQMQMVLKFLQNNVWGFENANIKASSEVVGIRETRRIMGDYVLTAEDLLESKKFDTVVVHKAQFCIDIHNPDGAGQSESDTIPVQVLNPYDIPYEVMLPRKVENLYTSGRCISGTHRAHASYRVMNIAAAIGQAAGVAAALCVEEDVNPRNLDVKLLQNKLLAIGVELFD